MKFENKKDMLERILHHNMAAVGGFLAGYAVLTRCDFLANAQTANLMHLAMALVGNDFKEVILRFNALILYGLSCFFCVIIKKKTNCNVKLLAIVIDAVAMLILANISSEVNPIIALIPVFIAMPFQWCAFPGSYGYNSSTIFSSNNVRQIMVGLADYICEKDLRHLHRAGFFLGSVVAFNLGVIVSYYSVKFLDIRGSLVGSMLLIPAFVMILKDSMWTKRGSKE